MRKTVGNLVAEYKFIEKMMEETKEKIAVANIRGSGDFIINSLNEQYREYERKLSELYATEVKIVEGDS